MTRCLIIKTLIGKTGKSQEKKKIYICIFDTYVEVRIVVAAERKLEAGTGGYSFKDPLSLTSL